MPYMRRAILVQYAVGRPHKGGDDVTFCGMDAKGRPIYVRSQDAACCFIKREDAGRWLYQCQSLPTYEHLGAWEVCELPTR